MKFFRDRGLGQMFMAAVVLAGTFPLVNLYLIYPQFKAQMLEGVRHQARMVVQHLSRMATVDAGTLTIALNRDAEPFLLQDFGLLKMKVFDPRGTVIFSSDPSEVGARSQHDYFHDLVAHGREFTQVVVKEEESADGERVKRDVVETYLPLMINDSFAGAFELYYDIDDQQQEFTRIYMASLLYPVPVILIFLGLVGYILKRLDTKNAEQWRDQRQIEAQRNTLLLEQEKQRQLLSHIENAKRQWEATMDRVDDMVILTDAAMRVRRCNRAVALFCGLSFVDIQHQCLPDLFVGLDVEQGGNDGHPVDYYHAASRRWFSISIYRTDQGSGIEGLVVTLHDMTEIKRVTAELETKNQEISLTSKELQSAIDQISALIQRVVAEEDFGTYFQDDSSPHCYEVKNCGQEECPVYARDGVRCWQEAGTFCEGKVQGKFAQKYDSCKECGYFRTITTNPINMIGEQFNNMMHMLEGKSTALQTAYSELKQAQSQLLQQEKMASIGQLAAGVAHEINNPVGFIASNLSSLRKYCGRLAEFITLQAGLVAEAGSEACVLRHSEGKKQYKIDFILSDIDDLISESLDGCDRVKKIVQDLKGFSRIDQATRQTVNIHECLDATLNIVWNELKYKTKIVKEYQAVTPIACFPQQLNQVFMNLLINAAHAIDKEGVITIRTWQDETALSVAIGDTGCGIAAEHVGRIFEPFFTTKEVGKGTGLGLSIVYDIVTKNHHGDILVESQPGAGTTFTIHLPFSEKS